MQNAEMQECRRQNRAEKQTVIFGLKTSWERSHKK